MITLVMSDDTDTDVEIPIRMRDILLWEKSFPARSLAALDESRVKLTYLYEICYVVARARGLVDCTYTEFGDRYDVAETSTGEAAAPAADPTPAVVSTTPSASLPLPPESVLPTGDVSLSATNA
jgi:hypothetical protein